MLNIVKFDCRTITGRNCRKIELETNQDSLGDEKINFQPYFPMSDDDKWRTELIKEMKMTEYKEFSSVGLMAVLRRLTLDLSSLSWSLFLRGN